MPTRDIFETTSGNNTYQTATKNAFTSKTTGKIANLSLYRGVGLKDEDWYRFSIDGNKATMTKNYIQATFKTIPAGKKAYIAVYDDISHTKPLSANGKTLSLATSNKVAKLSLDGLAPASGTNKTYYVRIWGDSGVQSQYDLVYDRTNYTTKADTFESNNTLKTAKDQTKIISGALSGTIHTSTDVDLYKIRLANSGTSANTIKVNFWNPSGKMRAELLNSSGVTLTSKTNSIENTTGGTLSLAGRPLGTYYIKISGASGKNRGAYNLTWNTSNTWPVRDQYDQDDLAAGKNNNTKNSDRTPDLGASNGTLSATFHKSTDIDYYKFLLRGKPSSGNVIKVTFPNWKAGLATVKVEGLSGLTTIPVSKDGVATINLSKAKVTKATSFAVKVTGPTTASGLGNLGKYTLTWDTRYGAQGSGGSGTVTPSTPSTPSTSATTPDKYDKKKPGNNTPKTATFLNASTGSEKSLTIHSKDDVDYYKFTLPGSGSEYNYLKTKFNTPADITLDIGTITKDAFTSIETITPDATGAANIDLSQYDAGTYALKISGISPSLYSLSWNTKNYWPSKDRFDTLKKGDTQDDAIPLEIGSKRLSNLSIHSLKDEDWYEIQLDTPGDSGNYIQLTYPSTYDRFTHVELLQNDGTDITDKQRISETNGIIKFTLNGLTETDGSKDSNKYYLHISDYGSSVNARNKYTLTWNTFSSGPDKDKYDDKELGDEVGEVVLKKQKGTFKGSIHTASDKDYYTIHMPNVGTGKNLLSVMVSDPKLKDTALNVKLYKPDSNGNATTSGELKADTGTKTGLTHFTLLDQPEGDYVLYVDGGTNKNKNTYKVTWDLTDYGPKADKYESQKNASDSLLGNNDSKHPTNLKSITANTLNATIHKGGDVDWYKMELTGEGGANNQVTLDYTPSTGKNKNDLNLEIFKSDGKTSVGGKPQASTNGTLSLQDLDAGTYLIKVSGKDSSTQNTYTLSWDASNTGVLDDKRSNNTQSTATPLQSGTSSLDATIHSKKDVDYYKIHLSIPGRNKNFIKITYDAETSTAKNSTTLSTTLTPPLQQTPTTNASLVKPDTSIPGVIYYNLANQPAGDWILKVGDTAKPFKTKYSIQWDSTALAKDWYDNLATPLGNSISNPIHDLDTKPQKIENLTIHNDKDLDYFQINLKNTGGPKNSFTLSLKKSDPSQDLKAEIVDFSGKTIETSSDTGALKTLSLAGLPKTNPDSQFTQYSLKVSAADNKPLPDSYDLSWNTQDFYANKQDAYDKNNMGNTTKNPIPLPTGSLVTGDGYTGSISNLTIDNSNDVDWYKYTFPAPRTITFTVKFGGLLNKDDKMNIDVYDSSKGISDNIKALYSWKTTDRQTFSVTGEAGKEIYIKISSESHNLASYAIAWDQKGTPKDPIVSVDSNSLKSTPAHLTRMSTNDTLLKSVTSLPSVVSMRSTAALSHENTNKQQGILTA